MPEHFFHFSENFLRKLLNKTGFKIKKVEHLPSMEIRGNVYNFVENIFSSESFLIKFLDFKGIKLLNRILQVAWGYFFLYLRKAMRYISKQARKSNFVILPAFAVTRLGRTGLSVGLHLDIRIYNPRKFFLFTLEKFFLGEIIKGSD